MPYYFDTPYDYNVIYSLDDKCHVDYAEKLIPRAVGYSATLLQYFFRGDISMSVAPDNAGKYVVENLSDEAMSGTFSLYADDADGNRTIIEGSTITMDIPAHGVQRIEAFLPPVAEKAAVGYLLVFVGTLGQEANAVVAVKVDPTPPVPIVVQEDPAPGWNRYQVVNNSDKTISGLLSLRYVSNEMGQLVDKPVANVSWPVTLAPGEQVDVKAEAFAPLVDAKSPDQYQLVFKGTVNGESESLLYNRLTIPAIKPGWVEEWNSGLTGSHPWLTTSIELLGQNSSNNGRAVSVVENGQLVKDNIRYSGYQGARVNQTLIQDAIVNASGQYCVDSSSYYCVPYDFGVEFPLPITTSTVLRVKIDEMSVTPGIAHYNNCSTYTAGYGEYQGITMVFSNGAKLAFTLPNHEPPVNLVAYFTPGVEYAFNVSSTLEAVGYPFSDSLTLRSISIAQQLGSLCSPSTTEHSQRIKIDYIRMEEDPNYGGY